MKVKGVATGGRSNWLGVISENIYPKLRYAYNPIFQLQELIEPYFLNTMRGVLPGSSPSDMDKQTLRLLDVVIHRSRYAMDDQIKRQGTLLLDIGAGRAVAKTRIGRLLQAPLRVNIREIKALNYARLQRSLMGEDFKTAILDLNPSLWSNFEAAFGTLDPGEIAIRFMSERMNLKMERPEWRDALFKFLKPDHLGKREPINFHHLVLHMPPDLKIESGLGLRQALRSGALDDGNFADILRSEGADSAFIANALRIAHFPEVDEFWRAAADVFPGDVQQARTWVRLMAQIASGSEDRAVSEAEILSRLFADLPMSVDAENLARLSDSERRSVQFFIDLKRQAAGTIEDPSPLERSVREFVDDTRLQDYESLVIVNPETGELRKIGNTGRWDSGNDPNSIDMPEETWLPGTGPQNGGQGIAKDMDIVHHHPGPGAIPLSSADLRTAIMANARSIGATPRAVRSVMRRHEVDGWLTPQFMAEYKVGVGDILRKWLADPNLSPSGQFTVGELLTRVEAGDLYGPTTGFPKMWSAHAMAVDSWLAGLLYGTESILKGTGIAGKHYKALSEAMPQTFNRLVSDLGQQRLLGLSHNLALDELAHRFGWEYRFEWDKAVQFDADSYARQLHHAANHPDPALVVSFPPGHRGRDQVRLLEETPIPKWDMAFEISSPGRGTKHSLMVDDLPQTVEDQQFIDNLIAPDIQNGALRLFNVALDRPITDSLGGWTEGATFMNPNIYWVAAGTTQQIEALAGGVGYWAHQEEVMASRILPTATKPVVSRGQRWAIDLVVHRGMTADSELPDLSRRLAGVMGDKRGFQPVVYADGKRGLRFVFDLDTARPKSLTYQQFSESVNLEGLRQKIEDATQDTPYTINLQEHVVETVKSRNHWTREAEARGQGHLGQVERSSGGRIRGGMVSHGLQDVDTRLHHALKARFGTAYDRHIARVRAANRAAGGRNAEFSFGRVVRPVEPIPSHPRSIFAPDIGHAGEVIQPMPLQSQHILVSQQIDPITWYEANPEQYARNLESIHLSKLRTDADLTDLYDGPARVANATMMGALTGNTGLDVSEYHFRKFRLIFGDVAQSIQPDPHYTSGVTRQVPSPFGGVFNQHIEGSRKYTSGIAALNKRRNLLVGLQQQLPDEFRWDVRHLGLKWELDDGRRLGVTKLETIPEHLYPSGADHVAATLRAADDDMLGIVETKLGTIQRLLVDGQITNAEAEVKRRAVVSKRAAITQRALDADPTLEHMGVVVTPWNIEPNAHPLVNRGGFVTVSNPLNISDRVPLARTGSIALWLIHNVFDHPNASVRKFMVQQPFETRDEYLWRLGAMLPQMGGKTASMAGSALGPSLMHRPPSTSGRRGASWSLPGMVAGGMNWQRP